MSISIKEWKQSSFSLILANASPNSNPPLPSLNLLTVVCGCWPTCNLSVLGGLCLMPVTCAQVCLNLPVPTEDFALNLLNSREDMERGLYRIFSRVLTRKSYFIDPHDTEEHLTVPPTLSRQILMLLPASMVVIDFKVLPAC